MTRIESRMMTAEAAARTALETLSTLAAPVHRPQLAARRLDRLIMLNSEIVARRAANSNVRSLAMSLGQKRTLTAACQDSLRALQRRFVNRGFAGTRQRCRRVI
jgi:hypothetical protein